MARNPHPEVTERRILETARALFARKGFEKTSIQDIVNELGDLSKGAIYHHFKSKDDILDRLNADDWEHSRAMMEQLWAEDGTSALERLRTLFRSTLADTAHLELGRETLKGLDDPKAFMSNMRFWSQELPNQLLPIIEDGVEDGSIPTEYPREAAQLLGLLPNYWLMPHFYPAAREEMNHRIRCLAAMLDAIGVPVFSDDLIALATDGMMVLAGEDPGTGATGDAE